MIIQNAKFMHSHYNYFFNVQYTNKMYIYARHKGLKMSLWLWYEQNVHMFKNIHIFVIFSQLILSVGYTIMVEHESYFVHGMGFYADVYKK